jgi:hypothetical protein
MTPRSVRCTLRIVVLVAVVAVLQTILAPPVSTHSPYASALSNLVSSPVYAAGCPDKGCDHGISCVSAPGLKCIRFNGKGCTATLCG